MIVTDHIKNSLPQVAAVSTPINVGPGIVVPPQSPRKPRMSMSHHIGYETQTKQSALIDPEDLTVNWTTPAGANQIAQTSIIVTSCAELPAISLAKHDAFNSVISLKSVLTATADDTAPGTKTLDDSQSLRPPMDIICVLDKSGSMESDGKMTNLKFAMSFIRDEMKSDDRLGVVTFDSSANVLHQLLRMTDANKARVGTALSNVPPSGGTSILSGMQRAQAMLENRHSKNPIAAVFLLTDGIDGSNAEEKKRVARAMKEAGVSLFVFGFGADHDSAHLNMIANAAEGSFSFIEQVSTSNPPPFLSALLHNGCLWMTV